MSRLSGRIAAVALLFAFSALAASARQESMIFTGLFGAMICLLWVALSRHSADVALILRVTVSATTIGVLLVALVWAYAWLPPRIQIHFFEGDMRSAANTFLLSETPEEFLLHVDYQRMHVKLGQPFMGLYGDPPDSGPWNKRDPILFAAWAMKRAGIPDTSFNAESTRLFVRGYRGFDVPLAGGHWVATMERQPDGVYKAVSLWFVQN